MIALEAELAALRDRVDPPEDAGVRIAVLHPQTSFVRGGAETHTEALVTALRDAGHEAELVSIAGKWYPADELAHQMAVWRSFDISESNGLVVDAVDRAEVPRLPRARTSARSCG